ncbi:MAG: hypothetical protein M3424_02115, partial [Actinomycetota bacterium]|nr:hypothetical protein [Actinomycetota bacterium]
QQGYGQQQGAYDQQGQQGYGQQQGAYDQQGGYDQQGQQSPAAQDQTQAFDQPGYGHREGTGQDDAETPESSGLRSVPDGETDTSESPEMQRPEAETTEGQQPPPPPWERDRDDQR